MTDAERRSAVVTFLLLTVLFSAVPWALIAYTGQVGGGDSGYVFALMWAPGFAALATVKLKRLDIGVLGLGWGSSTFNWLGYLIPIGYALIAYAIIWATGLGGFPNTEAIGTIAKRLGWTFTDPTLFVPVFFLFTGITGMLVGIASGLGEEIGWRGFLAPQLAQGMGFTKAGLIGGLIWSAWHFPLILFANYNNGTPAWYSILCFTLMVIGIAFIMSWLRLMSGSTWPAAIMHGSHNLFIQTILTPLTIPRGSVTAYAIDEFGFMLPITIGAVALLLWTRRGQAVDAMNQRLATTGNP